jgi:hypothetical protein
MPPGETSPGGIRTNPATGREEMNKGTLVLRARNILSTHRLKDAHIEGLLSAPAKFLLIGEGNYGNRYVYGFRHTMREAVAEFFHHDKTAIHTGDISVRLRYLYDLESDDYETPIEIGPIERIVKIGDLTVSDLNGVVDDDDHSPGDTVMVRSSGCSPVCFYEATVVSVGRTDAGEKTYDVMADPFNEGRPRTFSIRHPHVFEIDPNRELPYKQYNG